jgi:hypothetical protein
LREPQNRQERARKGREAVLEGQGASRRHLDVLSQTLASRKPDRETTEATRGI